MNNQAVVISYPNQVGDAGRYTLIDQRNYFSRFNGGARHFFCMALEAIIHGSLAEYEKDCQLLFDAYYDALINENTASVKSYPDDRTEFARRIFDIYRYAKTSIDALGPATSFDKVRQLSLNRRFDTGSFILS